MSSNNRTELIDLTDAHVLPDPVPAVAQPLRRSTRTRRQTEPFTIDVDERTAAKLSAKEQRLEQLPYCTAEQLGIDPLTVPYIRIHPIAVALITFHAHLTQTEIIGYLGGFVTNVGSNCEILIAEAFPAQNVKPSDLAKTGRSAFSEVEALPESTIEIASRAEAKGMRILGWYHSHPDETFTTEPSRVDIECQHDFQQHIYKDDPFVAAIIAPYNEQLPDHRPDLQFFRVSAGDAPLQMPFEVCYSRLAQHLYPLRPHAITFPLDEFMGECYDLVSEYSTFGRRVRLEKEWRDDVLGVVKLKRALYEIVQSQQLSEQEKLYHSAVDSLVLAVEQAWKDSAEQELEKRRQNAAKKRKKRSRRW
ncbi:Histone H2A deubiquitinase MYSM1 [Gracilaria domingensis]|nr:Histone H2A deubiquitinase MYSM1 [Gracilaria domingensis]